MCLGVVESLPLSTLMIDWCSLLLLVVLGVVEGLSLDTLMINRFSLLLFVVLGGDRRFTLEHADD